MTSRVGYLAPTGMFISLTQSNADEDKLMRWLDTGLVPTGVQDVERRELGGLRGRRPDGDVPNAVWTTRLNGHRVRRRSR